MQTSRKQAARQRGSIIVYLAVALVTFGILTMVGLTRFGATVMGVLSPNCATQARLMAESGVRYATARLRACADASCVNTAIAAMNGTTYTVDASLNESFALSISYNSGTATAVITATGTGCNIASPNVSAQSGSVNLPQVTASADPSISFQNDIASFAPVAGFNGVAGINVDTAAKTVGLGNWTYTNVSSIWYTGSNSFCTNGNCTVGNGVCAYWEFQFNSASQGDGYFWTIMSGYTNTATSLGGDVNMGELMGYAGPGPSGKGIKPPKLGLEFDAYYNYHWSYNDCSPFSRDDVNSNDHVAFMFWGSQSVLTGCDATYDDNRHMTYSYGTVGAGNASEPVNSYSLDGGGDGWDGYYYRPGGDAIWMERGDKYLVRYELDRPTTANADGNYVYLERAWIKKSTDTYSANMNNCSATDSDAPALVRSFALTPDLHTKLSKAFFGFTEGTGGATQYVTLSKFILMQKAAPTEPTAPTVPSGYVAGYSFSEVQGATSADSSGNSNTLTGVGSAMWGPDVRSVSGGSLFVAGSGYARANDSNSLGLTNKGTLSAWVKLRSYVEAGGIIHKGSTLSDEAYCLQLSTAGSGKVAFQIQNSHGTQLQLLSSGTIRADGNWHHLAVTWDNSWVRLYIDGSLSSSTSNSVGAARDLGGYLLIGAQQYTSPYYGFDGYIDDVYIFNSALNATQIAGLATGHP